MVSLSQVEAKGLVIYASLCPIIVKIDCFPVPVVKIQNIRTLTITHPTNHLFLSSGNGF